MAREEKGTPDTEEEKVSKQYYYKVCPRCGAKSHIDNMYCVKCGGSIDAKSGLHKTDIDPGLTRSNLDHPNGCPSCGLGCRYCFSFSVKKPHLKARCEHCEQTRAVCCIKARKLPTLIEEVNKTLTQPLSVAEIFAGKAGNYKVIREEFDDLYALEVGKCWSHCKEPAAMPEAVESAALPFEVIHKRAAG
jgi:ribosomal protein L40E